MTAESEVLFELMGLAGDGLRVVAGEPFAPNAADLDARSWVHARLEVRAHPFAGTIETVYMPEDMPSGAARRKDCRTVSPSQSAAIAPQRSDSLSTARTPRWRSRPTETTRSRS